MAVQALYYSERDGLEMALKHPDTMLFSSKAEADARDKVLELAEEITALSPANKTMIPIPAGRILVTSSGKA